MVKCILDIFVQATSGIYVLSCTKPIPQQTLRVVEVRVQYTPEDPLNPDTSRPLADQIVLFTAPRWLGGNAINSGKTVGDTTYTFAGQRGILIPISDNLVTVKESNYYVDMCDDMPLAFDYQIYGLNNNVGLASLYIKFEYDVMNI
jgi:hypothetical protein